jgi:hypothetical protein
VDGPTKKLGDTVGKRVVNRNWAGSWWCYQFCGSEKSLCKVCCVPLFKV